MWSSAQWVKEIVGLFDDLHSLTYPLFWCLLGRGRFIEPRLPSAEENQSRPEHCQDGKSFYLMGNRN